MTLMVLAIRGDHAMSEDVFDRIDEMTDRIIARLDKIIERLDRTPEPPLEERDPWQYYYAP